MASHLPPTPQPEGIGDDFLEQIFSISSYGCREAAPLHIGVSVGEVGSADKVAATGFEPVFISGLGLEESKRGGALLPNTSEAHKTEGDSVQLSSLFPAALGQAQYLLVRPNSPQQVRHGQATQSAAPAMPHPTAARPKVRARRGQATDPHSIAERLHRERIAERFRALQELLPNISKTDRAAMLDEILDYVKFLRLQVKILSMSRLGAAGAVAHLMGDVPLLSLEGTLTDCGTVRHYWEKWLDDGTEHQAAKLMEEDISAAMQFLRSKALCLMLVSLASAIYYSQIKSREVKAEVDQDAPS